MKTTLSGGALLLVSTLSLAQSPQWTVVVTPTLNPLPAGMCGAVHLTLLDPVTHDVPGNPQGYRINMAAFDMTVSGGTLAGELHDRPAQGDAEPALVRGAGFESATAR
jgi:hypothetical protein